MYKNLPKARNYVVDKLLVMVAIRVFEPFRPPIRQSELPLGSRTIYASRESNDENDMPAYTLLATNMKKRNSLGDSPRSLWQICMSKSH